MAAPIDPTCVLDIRGFYPFTDGATRKARDFSGYGNHGTETNFAGDDSEYVDGYLGQAVSLSGTKYLNCGTSEALNPKGQYSFEAIVSFNTLAGTQMIMNKGTIAGGAATFVYTRLSAGSLVFVIDDGPTQVSTAIATGVIIGVSVPVYIVGTKDSGTLTLYVNGVQVNTSTNIALTSVIATEGLWLGRDNRNQDNLDGYIHRFRSWTRCFGAAEIWDRFINAART